MTKASVYQLGSDDDERISHNGDYRYYIPIKLRISSQGHLAVLLRLRADVPPVTKRFIDLR